MVANDSAAVVMLGANSNVRFVSCIKRHGVLRFAFYLAKGKIP